MTSSCFFDNGPRKNDSFSGSFEEILERFTYLGSTLVDSPKQLPLPLPDSDPPSPLRAQPSTVRPPAREARHPAGFVVGLSNPMAHTSFDNRGRSPQPNLQRIPHPGPFFNPRDSIVTPTTQRSPATLGVGRPLVHGDLPSSVASGSSPVHDFQQYSSTCGPPRYNDPHMFVGQREPFHSAMGMPHEQMQLAPVSVVQNSSSIPSDSQLQLPSTRHPTGTSSFPIQSASPKEMVLPSGQWVRDDGMRASPSRPFIPLDLARQPPHTCRRSRRNGSLISSPYSPTRTSSLPVQSVSPKAMALHTCQWMGDDGMLCEAQITRADLSQHLTTHGVKQLAHNHRLSCRWLGCQLRGDKDKMKRESILRHVIEIHLGYKRAATK